MTNIFKAKISKTFFLSSLLLIKICGIAFALLIFARYTPLTDSALYLSGYYKIEGALRTELVGYLASFLNDLGGAYFAHFIFALFSISGLIYYCCTGGRHWAILLVLILPSSFIWTSIVGKEALYFGAMCLVLVVWTKYVADDADLLDGVLGLISVLLCFMLRPHYGISLLWIFIAAAILKRCQSYAIPLLFLIFIFGALIVYFNLWDLLLARGFGGIDPNARASRFTSLNIDPSQAGFLEYKRLIILGLIYGMIGPTPAEIISRPEFLPFFVEGVLIFSAPAIIYFWVMKSTFLLKKQFILLFWVCLVPAMIILVILHAPFGLLNPGSATRWRTNFDQMFYLAPLLLFFRYTDEEEKNTSLPS
ncbi:hypothetical protein G6695_04940 [Polynucleobacter paneuropaeus]|nr:hypothetical protein [Polynucleobacter paneuropaeus]